VALRFAFDDGDFVVGQVVEVVNEAVDLAFEVGAVLIEAVLLQRHGGPIIPRRTYR
jgi:hypothetical protein